MTLENLEHLFYIVEENNKMLKYIVKILNAYLYNFTKENEEDFNRNVLANLVSNIFTIDRK